MSATGAPQLTLERRHQPQAHRQAPGRQRTLEVEVIAGGDPTRLARILATLVNNSPMALARVTVGEHAAYPVPSSMVTRRGPMLLTLRMRNRSQPLDGLLAAEIVEIVSTMCRVVEARRRP